MNGDEWYDKIENILAREWFRLADEDLKYAKVGFKETDNYRMVCFDCQQVAEKYLKGYLQFKKIKFPKVHSLVEFLGLTIETHEDFAELEKYAKILDKYYIATRYPGGVSEIYNKRDAKEALDAVREIMEFIRKKI